jgi:hypothetical protein
MCSNVIPFWQTYIIARTERNLGTWHTCQSEDPVSSYPMWTQCNQNLLSENSSLQSLEG